MSEELYEVPQPGEWSRHGKCRQAPTSVFFPTRGDDVTQAQAICRACAVQNECRAYALDHPALHGVWGGLSEADRERATR